MPISIATFNVNSIRARLPNVLAWLRDAAPDIVLLQELKCVDEQFPALEIEEMGYNCAVYGEKTYNGVAILSKFPLEDVSRGLTGEETDTHSRYIEALAHTPLGVLRVASVYVPNGQEVGSDKFAYKLRFLDRLYARLKVILEYEEVVVIGGDYNVAPEAIDVYDPKRLSETVCFHSEERKRLRKILHLGYLDAFRMKHPTEHGFSWWDYRGGSFEAGQGLRIDHLLISPQAADKLVSCEVHAHTRAAEKASDHAPVVGVLG
jgi:exodeoxyribonuclease III